MRILCIGGDRRMAYAADYLNAQRLFLGDYPEPSGKFDAIVLPLPLTKDGESISSPLSGTSVTFNIILQYAQQNALIFAGGTCASLEKICDEHNFPLINYFAGEPLQLKNAALTAEAAAAILSQNGDGALLGADILITGYGRIARFLAKYLKTLGSRITIAARNPASRAAALLDGFSAVDINEMNSGFDYAVNTAPAHIFEEDFFERFGGAFMELATLDGEREKLLCGKNGAKYISAKGLPGKHFPKTAGKFIAQEVKATLTKCDAR